jgi:hypothetical protein
MKKVKLTYFSFILMVFLFSCSKEKDSTDNSLEVLQSSSNRDVQVIAGTPNCTETISGKVKLKVAADASQDNSPSKSVNISSRTEKLYPSGGYILVFELLRTNNKISIEYKQVNTACGNPATGALSPATSTPQINNLSTGSYPIEIKVNGIIHPGLLNVPSSGIPILVMQTTNEIIIE